MTKFILICKWIFVAISSFAVIEEFTSDHVTGDHKKNQGNRSYQVFFAIFACHVFCHDGCSRSGHRSSVSDSCGPIICGPIICCPIVWTPRKTILALYLIKIDFLLTVRRKICTYILTAAWFFRPDLRPGGSKIRLILSKNECVSKKMLYFVNCKLM